MAPTTTPVATIPLVCALAGNGTWLAYVLATAAVLLVASCIARYARSRDYHVTIRGSLQALADRLLAIEPFDYKICVDTAPLLERSYARQAGLGWIGKNTCLINEPRGSWFFLGTTWRRRGEA